MGEDHVTKTVFSRLHVLARAMDELEAFDIVVGVTGQKALAAVRQRVKSRGKRGSRVVQGRLRVVDIATIHEFGSRRARIPERSFLRATVRAHQQDIRRLMRSAVQAVMKGANAREEAEKIALRMEAATKRTLTLLRTPPLAPSTIARRKALTGDADPNPLIDTGQLRASIVGQVREKPLHRRAWARFMRRAA